MVVSAEPRWVADGDRLRCPFPVHAALLDVAQAYALHRLRRLRARVNGLHHPVEVHVDGTELRVDFEPTALRNDADGVPTSPRAWGDHALATVGTVIECHAVDVAGFGPQGVIGTRWVAPPSWFLPPSEGASAAAIRDDVALARAWVERVARPGAVRDAEARRLVDGLLADLSVGDIARLRRRVDDERQHAAQRDQDSPRAPSFLTLLTEGELLERAGSLYRYRVWHEPPRRGADLVLEIDRAWRDPHFPKIERPSPQQLWDELIEESRVTPLLACSATLPDPLRARTRAEATIRWVGVHADQPLLHVRTDGAHVPSRGYVRLHSMGDDTLMTRKRTFTRFAGLHPALARLRARPPAASEFTTNKHARDRVEDAILAARGVFAVQGPPGTGKTHLATSVVRKFLASAPPGARVLVCAKEHFALQHITSRITSVLTSDGIPFRAWRSISSAKRRRDRGSLDEAWTARPVTRDLAQRAWRNDAVGWAAWDGVGRDGADERLASLAESAANLYFATTADASMVDFLDVESFDLVIVEEAGKCYPSELLHALCLGRIALMIGDHRQLPPHQEERTKAGVGAWGDVLSRAAGDQKLRASLEERFGPLYASLASLRDPAELARSHSAWLRPFEYLFNRLPTRHRLEEQYRMEAPLARVIGTVFYGRPFDHRKDELVAAGSVPQRPLRDAIPSAFDVPLLWIDTPHMTEHADATEDARKEGVRDNAFEVDVIVRYVRSLQAGEPIDLVVLTPYNAQKRLLLQSEALRTACRRMSDRPLTEIVRTTDEYQGREAELTVLSLVRNNSLGSRPWGFMTEPERLNVMFSRARYRQVVVGCSTHVERHPQSAEWLLRVWRAYQLEASNPKYARIVRASELPRG